MSAVRDSLKQLPTCATTGIGSLPYEQVEDALEVAFRHDVPYLPQLPVEHPAELMVAAAFEGLPGFGADRAGSCVVELEGWRRGAEHLARKIDEALRTNRFEAFEPSVDASRAYRRFLAEVKARRLAFAKVQLAGPVTLRLAAETATGLPVSDLPGLEEGLFLLVEAKAMAMAQAVRRAGATPVVFLDEPGLVALSADAAWAGRPFTGLQRLVVALQRRGALVGIHCCANTAWPKVLGLGVDLVSLDAGLSLDAMLADGDAWRGFLGSGATLSLGVIPTDLRSRSVVSELCDSVEASLRATVPPGFSFEAILSRMLLTPACGLATRTVAEAARIAEDLREAQDRLRALLNS